MDPDDKRKTAFSTRSGQYQWTRMPFGLKNSSAVFSRMMRKLLDPLERSDVHNFIDDVLVASETWEEHLSAIDQVMHKLKEHGLTAKPSKCCFGFATMAFLGHELSQGKLSLEEDKVEKLRDAERPTSKKGVRYSWV